MENNHIIQTKDLGAMSLIYVLVFYDYPRIFLCKNNEGLFFIFSESDIGNDFCEWAVAPISYNQILDLNAGKINLTPIYTSKKLYLVLRKASDDVCETKEFDSLPFDKLPDLACSYSGFIDDYHRQLVQDIANKSNRPVVSFAINNGYEAYPSAPYGEIKRFGDPVMKTATSICHFYRENNMNVVLSAASTVINFEFSDPEKWQGTLLKEDEIKPSEKIVTTIARMNSASDSEELLNAAGRDLGTIRAYKTLVRSFSKVAKKSEVSAIVATPGDKKTELVNFSQDKIKSALGNIEAAETQPTPLDVKEFVISGTLVGLLSKESKTFQFSLEKGSAPELPPYISGSADEKIFKDNPGFTLNNGRYLIKVTRTIDSSSARKKTHFVLNEIEKLPEITSKQDFSK